MAESAGQSLGASRPSSWIDRLVGWIEGLPVPTWLFYVSLLGAGVLLDNIVFWIDGGLPPGSFDVGLSMFAVFALVWIVLYHFLNHYASRALRGFRSMIQAGETEIDEIEFELTTLPRNLGWLTLPLGIVIAVTTIPTDLSAALGPVANQSQTVLPAAYFTSVAVFFSTAFFAFFFRTIRQLRLISTLHKRATNIDLLSLQAPHAFSALTARIGAGLILTLVLFSIPLPGADLSELSISAIDIVFSVAIAVLAMVVFYVPLAGMRDRLRQEKDRALAEVDELYRTASHRLNSHVRNGDYENTAQMKDAMSALLIQRDRLVKISTWPWDPGTARGFTSTLLLPIFLLLMSQLLERLF